MHAGNQLSTLADGRGDDRDAATRAVVDPVTGLYNRREAERLLRHMLGRAGRHGAPLALVIIQVDQLERLDQLYGVAVGDAVMAAMAAFCSARLRGSDVFARWDDAAFALLMPGTTAREACGVAQRLRDNLENACFAGICGLTCGVGASDSRGGAGAGELADNAAGLARGAQAQRRPSGAPGQPAPQARPWTS